MYHIQEPKEYKLTIPRLLGFLFLLPFSLLLGFVFKNIKKITSLIVILAVIFSVQNANAAAVELFSMSLFNDANLQAYYRLENVNDAKNSYHLTNFNSVPFNAAKFNNGADGGATNASLRLATSSTLGISDIATSISFSFWVKMNTEIGSGNQVMFEKTLGPNNPQVVGYSVKYEYNAGTRRLNFTRAKHGVADNACFISATLGTTNWTHIALTWDGSTVRGYTNGTEGCTVASSGSGATDSNLTNRFAILSSDNGYAPGSWLSGIVDDMAVFNRQLTATEVSDIANGTADTTRGEEYQIIFE